MEADEQFCVDLARRREQQQRRDRTARVGDLVKTMIDRTVEPQHAKFGSLEEVWEQLLPVELSGRCELAGVSGGQLKVRVDSPTHMYELKLCSSELVSELQQQCPRAGIKNIKFVMELKRAHPPSSRTASATPA